MQAVPASASARRWAISQVRPRLAGDKCGATPTPRAAGWTDLGYIALLVVIALSLRLYLVWHTEVAARDSIGYIRYAWQLGHQPWAEVLRRTEQPPLYALAVWAMSSPVRQFTDAPESIVMQWSAQLTSALAGVLLVIPMYFLGKELFDRGVAFWATLLFQCFPATGRFLSDGLSEAMFLLFSAFALWLSARALRTRSAFSFAFAGVCGGFAYLTRTEGGLLVGVTGLVLMGCQAKRAWRLPWKRLAVCAACLGIGALIVAGPYMAVIGGITNKHSVLNVFHNEHVETATGGSAVLPLAVWWNGDANSNRGWWGLWALATELGRGVFYIGWLAALLGLWAHRHRLRTTPGHWLVLVLGGLLCAVLWRLANVMGYLSDRHCLLILLCAMFWIAAGMRLVGEWIACRVQPYCGEWTAQRGFWRQLIETRLTSGRALASFLILGLLAAILPKSLEPLHANRAGLRQAGMWLSEHTDPGDEIVDPYCWVHYYAGRVFLEGLPNDPAPGHVRKKYAVIEHGKSDHLRLARLGEARKLEQEGRLVYRWAGIQGKHDAEIVVYACD